MKWKGPGPCSYPDPTSWTYPPSAHTHTQQSWFSSSRSAWLVFAIYTSLLILLFCLLLLFVAIEQIGGERLLSEIPVGFLQTTPITRWLMSTLFSSVCVLRACVCFFLLRLVNGMSRRGMSATERSDLFLFSLDSPITPVSLSFCVCAFPSPHSMSFFLSRNHFRCHLLGSLIILLFFLLFILLHSCGFYWHSRLCAAAVSVDIKSSSSSSRNLLCRPPLPPPPPQESKNFFFFFRWGDDKDE